MKYTCNSCGEIHEGWCALAYPAPASYFDLSEEEKQTIATLSSDFCEIRYADQTDRFIRCVLIQQVNGHCEDLEYGLWVSLSEQSFQDYSDNFHNEHHETQYFGWLSNDLPYYHFKSSIPTTVVTKKDNQRPEIFPHKSFDHAFVTDYYNGISKKEAESRMQAMIK
jgi:hypothetical protein